MSVDFVQSDETKKKKKKGKKYGEFRNQFYETRIWL